MQLSTEGEGLGDDDGEGVVRVSIASLVPSFNPNLILTLILRPPPPTPHTLTLRLFQFSKMDYGF